mmetsp:Transcript_24135/g.66882  ORF Transcript_24135/g.66882 Transcript_24135/m.66882 type:complete len:185 (+) Transcript_24135:163-717(+)
MITIEGLAKSLGLFAAYFAVYEAYLGYFQPRGPEALETELGPFYEWFFAQNDYLNHIFFSGMEGSPSISEKAQLLAVLQVIAALTTVFVQQKLLGLCMLSWYYMSAARGHATLQTPYMPVVLTMFGFTHVSLVAHLLGGVLSSSPEEINATVAQALGEAPEAQGEKKDASTKSAKKGKKKKKSN